MPKWLIWTPGHIAIFVGDIFETSKNVTKYRPPGPYLLQKYFKRYKKAYGQYFSVIYFVNLATKNILKLIYETTELQ